MYRFLRNVTTAGVFVVASTPLTGCPNWNRPACPNIGVHQCVSNQPHFCSPTGELTPSGDEPCSAQHRVCAIDVRGRAHCAPIQDAAVAADAGDADVE